MLILTRKPTEVIMIGDDVKIMILGVNNGQVRIGIEAPKNIEVHRQEIYDRILRQRLEELENQIENVSDPNIDNFENEDEMVET